MQSNLAGTYYRLGLFNEALPLYRDAHSGRLKLLGEEHGYTLTGANNYASTLLNLERFEEAKSLLRRTVPVARRVLGDSNDTTLRARQIYAVAFCDDPAATLEDLREAMTTLEDAERITRRVFGGAHPLTVDIEGHLGHARAALRACETPPNELDEVEDA